MAEANIDGDVTVSTTSAPGRLHLSIDTGWNSAVDLIESLFDELPAERQEKLLPDLIESSAVEPVDLMIQLFKELPDTDEFLERLRKECPDAFPQEDAE